MNWTSDSKNKPVRAQIGASLKVQKDPLSFLKIQFAAAYQKIIKKETLKIFKKSPIVPKKK